MSSILMSVDQGDPVTQTTVFDVTERMWAEEARKEAVRALRQREEHFRLLVEQAYDGIFVTDPTGKFVDVNSAAAAMVGYTREELLQLSQRIWSMPLRCRLCYANANSFSMGRMSAPNGWFAGKMAPTFLAR